MKKTIVLTANETELLQALFDQEGSIQEAAKVLGISITTARNTLHRNIFNKLLVNSACGAIRTALALKLIDLTLSIEKVPPLFLNSSPALSSVASSSDC